MSSLFRRRKIDFLALGEAGVGLFPAALAALDASEAALLSLNVRHRDRLDLGLEHELDRRLDQRLGGGIGDAKHVLAVLVGDERAFLRYHRRENDGHELRGVVFLHGGHLNISSSLATAPLVTM